MPRARVRRGFMPAESEAAFQVKVEQLAAFMGWQTFHAPDNRPSANTGRVQRVAPGWPDLTFVRPPELFFAELKAETGRVRPEQLAVLDALRACDQEVHVWRPSNWTEIEARLRR